MSKHITLTAAFSDTATNYERLSGGASAIQSKEKQLENTIEKTGELFDRVVSDLALSDWNDAKKLTLETRDQDVKAGICKDDTAAKKHRANVIRNGLDRAMKRAGYEGRPAPVEDKDNVTRYLTRDGLNAIIADADFGAELVDFLANHADSAVAQKLLADVESAS